MSSKNKLTVTDIEIKQVNHSSKEHGGHIFHQSQCPPFQFLRKLHESAWFYLFTEPSERQTNWWHIPQNLTNIQKVRKSNTKNLQPLRDLYSRLFSASLLLHWELRLLPHWSLLWQPDRAFISSFRIILPIPCLGRGKDNQRGGTKKWLCLKRWGKRGAEGDGWSNKSWVGRMRKMIDGDGIRQDEREMWWLLF